MGLELIGRPVPVGPQGASLARSTQQALFQRAHDLGWLRAVVVVAEQVAQAVDSQPAELARKPALAAAPERSLDGNDDVAEEYAVGRGVGFAVQFLLMKAEHVGGAIELAVVAIEPAHFLVARK